MSDFPLNSFPFPLSPTETEPAYDSKLFQLINDLVGTPDQLNLVKNLTTVLTSYGISQQIVQLLYQGTGTVRNVAEINFRILELQLLSCICDQLTRIADGGGGGARLAVIVSVLSYPVNTTINPGQNGGPSTLYPIGWINWTKAGVTTDREFIQYDQQICRCPVPGPDWVPKLWHHPGVTLEATPYP